MTLIQSTMIVTIFIFWVWCEYLELLYKWNNRKIKVGDFHPLY